MTANITGGFVIGKLTYFFGTTMILCICIIAMIDLWPDPVAISILLGLICGVYFGFKWSKEGA